MNSANVASTIWKNVMSSVSINSDDKKVRYKMNCYNLCTSLIVAILLFIIAIICCHYTNHRSKRKKSKLTI